jgi:hypothetical protein
VSSKNRYGLPRRRPAPLGSILRVGPPPETRPSRVSGATPGSTDRVQGAVPTPDCGDDLIWIGGPCEGLWVIIGLDEETVDGGLEFADGSEDTALEAAL